MNPYLRAAGAMIPVLIALAGCGGTSLTENERKYADTCLATNAAFGQGGEAKRGLCECSARLMVPRLSPGELNALVNSSALNGQILTAQNTARHGFTIADYGNLMRKTAQAQPEIARTCGS
jgi:hypothetical protein